MNDDAMSSPMGKVGGESNRAQGSSAQVQYEAPREGTGQAEKLGEIRIVKGATWQEEIGWAAELVQHDENAPCVIFDDIPGCKKGQRILTNFFGGKRKNMTLGF